MAKTRNRERINTSTALRLSDYRSITRRSVAVHTLTLTVKQLQCFDDYMKNDSSPIPKFPMFKK